MGVNRERQHLIIFPEDGPYRKLLNGLTKRSYHVNASVIDVKNPCGGWPKVFEALTENLHLLSKYENAHILLLMDFDDKTLGELRFEERVAKFKELVPQDFENRVFLLGVNHKQAELLKKLFKTSDWEAIGKLLISDCPNGDLSNWNNKHLACNLPEIQRMKQAGVLDWLFTASL